MEHPTPDLFFETLSSYQRSALIKTAVELNVFTKIAEGKSSTEKIAEACQASQRGIRILCDSLTVLGFLKKNSNEYSLTESTSVFLNQHSPAYMGGIVEFMMTPTLLEGFSKLTSAVKNGGTAISEEGTVSPENPVWDEFAKAMMPMMMKPAQMMAGMIKGESDRKLKVLDIAASHGIFGISIAQKFQNAEIYAVDWKSVLEVASENANKFGVGDRHHTIAGSAFEVEFGEDYDLVLLTNFLHHFDPPSCETLLRKIHNSLAEDGKVFTLDFVPNDDRVSPPTEAMFSLIMLASTANGDAYTFAELDQMFSNAGYSKSEHHPLLPTPQHLVISSK